MQYFNTTILPVNVLPLSARGARLFIIICYYSCFILFYMLLYLFLSLFYLSVLYWKIFLFRLLTSSIYCLYQFSCSYPSKWDYVSKTLLTIFKGSLIVLSNLSYRCYTYICVKFQCATMLVRNY